MALHRIDGARIGSLDIAQDKAYSAAALDLDAGSIGEVSQPGQYLSGLGTTNDGRNG